MTALLDRITAACAGGSDDAMITFRAELAPDEPGGKVAPPTYPEGSKDPRDETRATQYVIEQRSIDGEVHYSVQLDACPSQANRIEESLDRERARGNVSLPGFEVVSPVDEDRTVRIPSLRIPHRYADAYLMNSTVGGLAFDKSEVGKSLQLAQPDDVRALYRHSPESLIFGAWNSHRKGRQARFPRVYRSEIIGLDPIVGSRRAGRMDPENLTGQAKPAGDGWEFSAGGTKAAGSKLSERGLGNIAPQEAPGGVTVTKILRIGSISFAGMRRLGFGPMPDEAAAAARTALVALALYGDRLAFGDASLWLRSGCDLVVEQDHLSFLQRGGQRDPLSITAGEALQLFEEARRRAAELGLAMADGLTEAAAAKSLQDAIRYAYVRAESDESK